MLAPLYKTKKTEFIENINLCITIDNKCYSIKKVVFLRANMQFYNVHWENKFFFTISRHISTLGSIYFVNPKDKCSKSE